MSSSQEEKRKRAYEIYKILKRKYPDARVLLNYNNPFELLVATILAAQCTDERVNEVTPGLFQRFPDPVSMSQAAIEEIEKIIKPTGFFKNKAKSIIGASKTIFENFSGNFPKTIEELITLLGVGRKTANVVVGNCFNKPAIIVDTHVRRIAWRLALGESRDPDKIEMELKVIIPEKDQTSFSYVATFHGRYTCKARRPLCAMCVIEKLCPYQEKTV